MSGFLLDTNIPSGLMRPRPEPRVRAWVDARDYESLYLGVVTIGELRKGFTTLPTGKRREALEEWLERRLIQLFAGGILPITYGIADL